MQTVITPRDCRAHRVTHVHVISLAASRQRDRSAAQRSTAQHSAAQRSLTQPCLKRFDQSEAVNKRLKSIVRSKTRAETAAAAARQTRQHNDHVDLH